MNKLITCIEDLSNELFYEIFDYLNGLDLYEAFYNLNNYFQQLINAPFLLLKINDSTLFRQSKFVNTWKKILNLNRQQIYSIMLEESLYDNEFLTSTFIFNSSFNHLESLYLCNFDVGILMSILIKLNCLPRLCSLKISTEDISINLNDIYQLIFNLPMLKYYKFFTSELDLPVSLPMAFDYQWTKIENLNIDHCCNFNELINILSYTPELRRLRFSDDSGGKLNSGLFSSISLRNLTSLSIHSYSVSFNEWEIFIQQIHPQLQNLNFITRSQDINYLNANRWEQFIQQYFPQLNKFSFEYYEYIKKDHRFQRYSFQPNQFVSIFWIQRKWFMDIEMDDDEIIYSIKPYKKTWYEYSQNTIINSSLDFSKSTRLLISGTHYTSSNELLIKYIKHILTITQIYHLDIYLYQMKFNTLITILNILPEVDSLKIRSIIFNDQIILSDEEHQIFASVIEKNKITKVYLQEMKSIGEFAIFTTLFPSMVYLKVNDINIKDILFYLLCIFQEIDSKHNNKLNLLCFRIAFIDDKLIEILKQIINDQNLLIDYTIKRILDCIYLQRKLLL